MKRNILALLAMALLLLLGVTEARAQIHMKRDYASDGVKFMKEHPDYLFLNKPDHNGFSLYWISDVLNPAALGLNKSSYYVIVETLDNNGRPKALLWDGALKQKIAKRATAATKRVVLFDNVLKLNELKQLHFEKKGFDEKYKYTFAFGLSSNGSSYARGRHIKITTSGSVIHFTNLDVKTEWSDNPSQWFSDKEAEVTKFKKVLLQEPKTLKGTKGWIFDISIDDKEERIRKYALSYTPKIVFWKDKDHKIPMEVAKMRGTELTYHAGMSRDDAVMSSVVLLNRVFPPQAHQYYFLDWRSFANASEVEELPNGNMRLKIYYEVQSNVEEGKHFLGNYQEGFPKEGELTLEVAPNGGSTVISGSEEDPRNLCPPHKFKISSKEYRTHDGTTVKQSTTTALPEKETLMLGKAQVELRRQQDSEGNYYYMLKDAVESDLWEYAMRDESGTELTKYYGNDASFRGMLDFLEKLNEKTRNANIRYTFTIPTYDELKKYAEANNDFRSYYDTYVDSIQICSASGTPLSVKEFEALPNKSGAILYGGFMGSRNVFSKVDVDDAGHNIQICLKAVPDGQPTVTKTTSIRRFGLMKWWKKQCVKCGYAYVFAHHSKAKSIQDLLTYANDAEDSFTPCSFTSQLIHLRDVDKIKENLLGKKWTIWYEKSKEVNFQSPDRLYKMTVSKKNKKDTDAKSVEIMIEKGSPQSIIQEIEGMGFKLIEKKLNIPPTYGTTSNSTFDSYMFMNEEAYKVRLSVFTYNDGRVSCYITFYVPFAI